MLNDRVRYYMDEVGSEYKTMTCKEFLAFIENKINDELRNRKKR
jgi:hypothetical protein